MGTSQAGALRIAVSIALVFCVLSSAAFVILIEQEPPALIRKVLNLFQTIGAIGLMAGLIFSGAIESGVNGATSLYRIMLFAIPINLVLFTVVAFLVTRCSQKMFSASASRGR